MTDNALPTELLAPAHPSLDLSFAAIDWQAPWLSHLNQLNALSQTVEMLSHQLEHLDELDADFKANDSYGSTFIADLLNTAMTERNASFQTQVTQTKPTHNHHAHTLQFVAQDDLPEGIGYEQFIGTTGNIPTRENLHDLFNGSIWLTFPKTKALLNYHHMLEIAAQSTSASNNPKNPRGRVRDTITVFDENGAILVTAEPEIGEALMAFNWQDSLVAPRNKWDNPQRPSENAKAAVYVFGHALLEQLIEPRKTLCAHSVVIHVTADFFKLSLPEKMSDVDNKLAEYMHHLLSQETVTPRQLAPLPILGVPYFWVENANSSFYDDHQVFRSGRRRKS